MAAQRLLDLAWQWIGRDIGSGLALSSPSYRDEKRGLAADCAARLRARLARPQRASGDWSIELPAGSCTCELCHTLRAFLEDKTRRSFEWPLAKQHRQHVHSRIDAAELPVTHKTRQHGSPYTLVLNKTDALYTREQEARIRDEKDLEWFAAQLDLNTDRFCPAFRDGLGSGHASRTRLRSRSNRARPYICRLSILIRLTLPSTLPEL